MGNPYPPYDELDPETVDLARSFLERVGIDCTKPDTEMTPYRLTHYLKYVLDGGPEPHMTVFNNPDIRVSGLVTMPDIHFWSACSHHCLPFLGIARIGYVPGAKIIGLSKIPLLVRYIAHGFWMQESVAHAIVDWFCENLSPFGGVGVQICALHTCQLLDLGDPPIPIMYYVTYGGDLSWNDCSYKAEFQAHIAIPPMAF